MTACSYTRARVDDWRVEEARLVSEMRFKKAGKIPEDWTTVKRYHSSNHRLVYHARSHAFYVNQTDIHPLCPGSLPFVRHFSVLGIIPL